MRRSDGDLTDEFVLQLIGVYDADGTVAGELSYVVGAVLGRRHCALCDVTHGLLRERADWRVCRATLPVGFNMFHRDDQPPAVRAAVSGLAPVVVAETTSGFRLLLNPSEIEACEGDPARLVQAVDAAVAAANLAWPEG